MASAGRILIIPKGNWKAETQYEMLDLVYHNGASWIARTNVASGIEPSEANKNYWQKMAQSGVAIETSVEYINCKANTSTSYAVSEPNKEGYSKLGAIHNIGYDSDSTVGNATLYQKSDTEGVVYANFDGIIKVVSTFIYAI
jgi:hypothetical protein